MSLLSMVYVEKPTFNWRMLDRQTALWACLLTLLRDGMRIDNNKAIIAITTRSSISVKARDILFNPARAIYNYLQKSIISHFVTPYQ